MVSAAIPLPVRVIEAVRLDDWLLARQVTVMVPLPEPDAGLRLTKSEFSLAFQVVLEVIVSDCAPPVAPTVRVEVEAVRVGTSFRCATLTVRVRFPLLIVMFGVGCRRYWSFGVKGS